MLDDPYNIAETIAIAQKLEIPIRDRLVKSQRLDVAAKLAERVETFRRAVAGITHEIVEPVFAGDDDKMCDATCSRTRTMTGFRPAGFVSMS